MKNKLKTMAKEPSTYAGAALVLNGAADLFSQMGQTLATTGSIKTAIISVAFGLFAMFMREGTDKGAGAR